MAVILLPAATNSGRTAEELIESDHRPAIIGVTVGDAVLVE
jgi:hypothetical protein